MSTDYVRKWEQILETVDKNRIPVHFIKKLVIKMRGPRRQETINISRLISSGLDSEQLEEVVRKRLLELDAVTTSVEFVLDVQMIAETVQPETDQLLSKL